MEAINNNIIFNTINNGIIILDSSLNILAWNNWLEIRTHISSESIVNKNICEEFTYINEKRLKRKIKSVLVTNNPAYYSVDPHHYFIEIQANTIVNKIHDMMQQNVTIIPYDIEKGLVCIYIYDNTKLVETNAKLEKLNEELKELSNRDPMTHAYNRRYFSEISQKMLNLSRRCEQNITIVILDIDNFKTINDTYGHAVGDDVIIDLAQNLEKCVRTSDIVSRFGGEEFVLLLYNVSLDYGTQIARKIREKIEKRTLNTKEGDLSYTVSLGVGQYDDKVDDNNIENTISRADKCMYIAKKQGRNRVVNEEYLGASKYDNIENELVLLDDRR